MKAVVTEIQVGGCMVSRSLEDTCKDYLQMLRTSEIPRTKIIFTIKLPDGTMKHITIRDEDDEVVAYGDFEGLPSFLEYAKEVVGSSKLRTRNYGIYSGGLK